MHTVEYDLYPAPHSITSSLRTQHYKYNPGRVLCFCEGYEDMCPGNERKWRQFAYEINVKMMLFNRKDYAMHFNIQVSVITAILLVGVVGVIGE